MCNVVAMETCTLRPPGCRVHNDQYRLQLSGWNCYQQSVNKMREGAVTVSSDIFSAEFAFCWYELSSFDVTGFYTFKKNIMNSYVSGVAPSSQSGFKLSLMDLGLVSCYTGTKRWVIQFYRTVIQRRYLSGAHEKWYANIMLRDPKHHFRGKAHLLSPFLSIWWSKSLFQRNIIQK